MTDGDTVEQSTTDPRLFIHHIPQTIVVAGNRTDTMGILPVDRAVPEAGSPKEVSKDISKTKRLYDWLLLDRTIQRIDVYRNVNTQDGEASTKHPYHIVEVTKADNTMYQVTVCDFENHLTYVERDTQPYQRGQVIQIADLVDNPKVWTARHITFEQWFDKIKLIADTDLDKMPIQNKHKNSNADVGEFLIREFTKAVMSTGKTPATRDNTPIILGQKKTTYGRIYSALQSGSIDGLENIRTYNQLFNYLVNGREGEQAPMPWLAKFRNRPAITAEGVLEAVDKYERDMGEEFTNEALDLIFIDSEDTRINPAKEPDMRRTGIEVNEAFGRSVISISEGMLPANHPYPRDVAEFIKAVREYQSTTIRTLEAA